MKIIEGNKIGTSFFEREETGEMEVVKEILAEVKTRGDDAVRYYTEKFDGVRLESFEVSKREIKEAYKKIDTATLAALKKAASNIASFAKRQYSQFKEFETKRDGIVVGQKIVPIERVGCYVPGGRYPLPSSALMSIIPAKVAGVEEIIVCSPKIQPATIVAADIAGADRIFNIGGVQAIGAMAYGTKSVPRVDKIVGPGNKYVATAKKEVYGIVGIDFIAGPSEVIVIADESADPRFVAADLLAQAEHDPNARADLITMSRKFAEEVNEEVEAQLTRLSTGDVAAASLNKSSIVIVKNLDEAISIANRRAPEHLELQARNSKGFVRNLRNYGSLFIGPYSAEVFGDYCTGTNHTLPTNGAARYTGGLSVKDFLKILTYQEIDKKGADKLAGIASKLAEVEGLEGHRKAAEMRKSRGYV